MILKGTIRGFDAPTHTATIEYVGSTVVWVAGVPVAKNIAGAEMVAGRYVAVQQWAPGHNAKSSVVIAVFT